MKIDSATLLDLTVKRTKTTILNFIDAADNAEKKKIKDAFDEVYRTIELYNRYGESADLVRSAVNQAIRKSLKAARALGADPPEE